MKKTIRNRGIFILCTIIIMAMFFIPVNVFAEDVDYKNINEFYKLNVGDLNFSSIKFRNNSNNSSKSFGLTGAVQNLSSGDIRFKATANFYDKNYNLIATTNFLKTVPANSYLSYSHMSNLTEIKSGYSADDIYYYDLAIKPMSLYSSNVSSSMTPSSNASYSDYDYVIDKYDINVVVNENNTFDITENLTVYFNRSKHGIYRMIPLKNTVQRIDGSKSSNRAFISNVSVNDKYSISRENNNYKIKIGSSDRTLLGKKYYKIKYTYNIGKDPVKDYDELYYNLIGTGWDTVIGNVSFTIKMPKAFDSSKLGFSSGRFGLVDNDKVNYNVDGNVITGTYNGILGVGEALTVRCELDEGYFVGAGIKINPLYYIVFVLSALFSVISLWLWYKYGRDDKVVETVEFYPPEGFNSLEVGFLYNGLANSRDVTSLLIYLANRGYIKITETDEKSLFSNSKGFTITKLKEYDGKKKNEKLFLDGLFKKKDVVSKSDLYNSFYVTNNKILSNINSKSNRNKIFERSASNKIPFVVVMIIVTFCLITIPPVLTYGESELLIFALLFPGVGFSTMISMLTSPNNINGSSKGESILIKVFGIVFGLVFGGVPFMVMVLPSLLLSPIYLIGYIVGLICISVMVVCLKYLPKRTLYGNEMLGKLRGFKSFLETAEKSRLEAMVMDNPTYFYDILPFTYVLGVSDKWIKKFEAMSLQAPSWYDSPSGFSMIGLNSFMNSTMSSIQSTMTSSPSSSGGSSGGSSSGGGFSGGGSGGGGGGSW